MEDYSFGVIPVYKDGKEYYFLLIKHHAGHWAFPKGHMEMGETEAQTAKREFEEETGIKNFDLISDKVFVEKYNYKFEKNLVDKTIKYFLAFVKDKKVKIQKEEVIDYKWLLFDGARDTLTFHGGKKVLEEAWKYINSIL